MDPVDISNLDIDSINSLNAIAGPLNSVLLGVSVVIAIIIVVALWRIFIKAGRPGWAAIVPFYNLYVLLKIIKKPGWWIILFFIPLVTYIIQIIVAIEIGKAFGKNALFSTIFLLLIPVGFLIIAFDKSKYIYAETEKVPVANPNATSPVISSTNTTV